MRSLWCSCAKAHEPVELLFVVVSGVSPSTGVLDGSPHPQGEGEVLGFSLVHWFEWNFVVH